MLQVLVTTVCRMTTAAGDVACSVATTAIPFGNKIEAEAAVHKIHAQQSKRDNSGAPYQIQQSALLLG